MKKQAKHGVKGRFNPSGQVICQYSEPRFSLFLKLGKVEHNKVVIISTVVMKHD
ncbi:hypothetical protein AT01_436 [Yersinia aldovae 670-83]|nr:hypothetical protein AT01_436 [Yersinia aldovae 670-83]